MDQALRPDSRIDWLPWNAALFARAAREGKPILLWITAAWSPGCLEMARTTYLDPQVIAALEEHFLAARVDADERPDIAERYTLGGVPTTAFVGPDGALLGGGTFVAADRLRTAMARARGLAGSRPSASRPENAADDPLLDLSSLTSLALSCADAEHGGFGGAPKFPHIETVRLALELDAGAQAGAADDICARALDAIGWGALFDPDDDGFFDYCAGADWTDPRGAKLASVNAALLDLYLHAAAARQQQRWAERAAAIVRFMRRHLRRQDGTYRAFAGPDGGRVFTDANAAACAALLHAARVFEDDELGGETLAAFERVVLAVYKPGAGVAHYGGGVRGLLNDQVATADASLDAWEATGNIVYRMLAEELMHYCVRTMWDGERGGFFDRDPAIAADEPAHSARSIRPFAQNCHAATLLQRLGSALDDDQLMTRAEQTLDAIAPQAAAQGPLAACYVRAARACGRA